jgi:hypothetical protein
MRHTPDPLQASAGIWLCWILAVRSRIPGPGYHSGSITLVVSDALLLMQAVLQVG